ncbi:MAG: heavy metal-responsive transcriptional regulator [Anaerolineae bacterium]
MLIGPLAKAAGVNPSTIRYYEDISLLPEPDRTDIGYRVYTRGDIARVDFIRRARELGFSLDEVREILGFRDQGEAPCPYVLSQVRAKVEEIEGKITELKALQHELAEIEAEAKQVDPEAIAAKGRICHLIQNTEAAAEV